MTNKLYYLLLLLLSATAFSSCSNDDDEGGDSGESGPNANMNIVTNEPAVARLEFPKLSGALSEISEKTFTAPLPPVFEEILQAAGAASR